MRELTIQERAEVNGGSLIVAAIGFGVALAGKVFAGGTATGWAIGSAGLMVASYSLYDAVVTNKGAGGGYCPVFP